MPNAWSKKDFPKIPPLEFAKRLRKESTFPERLLWSRLRAKRFADFKFRRQQILGNFIVDFLCEEKKLIIELDGQTHIGEKDVKRDAYFAEHGYYVLRIDNKDLLKDFEGTLDGIYLALTNPFPYGRG